MTNNPIYLKHRNESKLTAFERGIDMIWQLCIQYPDGKKRAIRTYRSREIALRQIDHLYAFGYPLHIAFVIRPLHETDDDIYFSDRQSYLQFA